MKCNRHELSRRFFVSAGSLTLAAACTTQTKKTAETVASATGTGGNPGSSGSAGAGGQGGQGKARRMNPATGGSTATGGPLTCTPSDDNIQGPYYRPEAPFRDDLTEPGMVGVRVTVQGRTGPFLRPYHRRSCGHLAGQRCRSL